MLGTCTVSLHVSQWVLDNDLFKLSHAWCSYSGSPTRQEFCLEDLL